MLAGSVDSLGVVVFAGLTLVTRRPQWVPSAAKRFVQETFLIGFAMRKVLSLFQGAPLVGCPSRLTGQRT